MTRSALPHRQASIMLSDASARPVRDGLLTAASNFDILSRVLAATPVHISRQNNPCGQLIGVTVWPAIRYSISPPFKLQAISTPLPAPSCKSKCARRAVGPIFSMSAVPPTAAHNATVIAALEPTPNLLWELLSINSLLSSSIDIARLTDNSAALHTESITPKYSCPSCHSIEPSRV